MCGLLVGPWDSTLLRKDSMYFFPFRKGVYLVIFPLFWRNQALCSFGEAVRVVFEALKLGDCMCICVPQHQQVVGMGLRGYSV